METQSNGPLIYCGPNLPGGILGSHTVFAAGIPPHIRKVIERNPEVGELIVPVSELQKTSAAIMVKGTRQNDCFVRVLQGFNRSEVRK